VKIDRGKRQSEAMRGDLQKVAAALDPYPPHRYSLTSLALKLVHVDPPSMDRRAGITRSVTA
jgi:hypothetical protein